MNRDMSLSKTTKSRIILNIIKSLKEIENKDLLYIYIDNYHDDGKILEKIAKRSGVRLGERYESGYVDVGEFISITFDSHVDRIIRKLEGHKPYYRHNPVPFKFDVDEKLINSLLNQNNYKSENLKRNPENKNFSDYLAHYTKKELDVVKTKFSALFIKLGYSSIV
jgi:hypothetical protein